MTSFAPDTQDLPDSVHPLLRLRSVSKTFGTTRVLQDLDLDLYSSEVVAVVGQNGSGKSTLIKILAGYHQPDAGAWAQIHGQDLKLGNPTASKDANLRFVHQDLALVGSLSTVENFALTAGYLSSGGFIRWDRERDRAREALARLGFHFRVDLPIRQLQIVERVGVAVARALAGAGEGSARPSVLVLDEPTASLPSSEVAQLFRAINAVRAEGVGVLYVSHHLDEVFELADRLLILRDGQTVTTCAASDLTHDGLVTLMLGQPVVAAHTADRSAGPARNDAVLEIDEISGNSLQALSLQAYSGQIIGFGGVAGSGREEIGPLLGGEIARSSGTVRVRGRVIKNGSPVDSRRKGIGYLPGERAAKASIGQFSLTENLTLLDLSPFSSRLRINRKPELKETQSWLDVLEVRPRDPNREIRTLSGGNQQKVIMGRLLRVKPDVLVLNEPTQGVDVGAKAAIHELIREAAASGAVVLLCSSDTEELVSLSDEVVVLYRGRTAAVFSGSALTDTALDRAMLGELSRPESDEPSVSTGGRS